jgi:ATP-binding cassette subfamily B protein
MHKEKRGNPLVYLFVKMWRYSEGRRKQVVLFWTMFVVAVSLGLFAEPLIFAKMIDVVAKEGIQEESLTTLFGLLGLIILIELTFWCLHGPGRVMERVNAFHVRANYRKHLLRGVMGLPMEWHVDHHSGDTIDKVSKGTTALYTFSEDSFEVIYLVVRLLGSYAMLVYFSPSSAYIVLFMVALTMWITISFDKVLVKGYEGLNHYENNVAESVFDSISNISTVIILRVERLIFRAIVHKIERPYELYKRNNLLNELKWFLTSMCCAVMAVLVLGAYFLAHTGTKTEEMVASVYLLINYLGRINELFYTFTNMYGDILQRRASVHNSEELTKDFKEEGFQNHVLPKDWRSLQVSDLTFSYHNEDGSDLHLDDVTLHIARGEHVAFIGETGSGKTTFLKVARGLYNPRGLKLTADGVEIAEGFDGIRQDIALVPQNPELFATTILENITLGAEYAPDFVRVYTDMACFTAVAEGLPKGLATSIKEKGVNLSGGQQQRLALARGLLASHDKGILLLDEPTSSLDAVTEMTVYQNIFTGCNGKTIISTIHRLHLLPLFDRIHMFEGGRIIASGTLSELLSSSRAFQALWQKSIAAS